MKSDYKLIVGTTLIAILAGISPTVLRWAKNIGPLAREMETQTLLSRSPAKATRELRGALVPCTEIRIWQGVGEKHRPHTSGPLPIPAPVTPGKLPIVLKGRAVQTLIVALHAESRIPSAWRPAPRPYRGIIENITILDFYAGKKWLGQIRFFHDYPGVSIDPLHHGGYIRWYTPRDYQGDSPLLLASRRYLEQLTKM